MANDLNKWIGIGRLVRVSELKYLGNGTAVCKFAIAVDKRIKKNEEWVTDVSFVDIVLWGKSGESLNQYLVKGKQVAIEGELHQNRWEQDGQSRSKIEIVASNVQLLGGKSEGHADAPPPSTPPRTPASAGASTPPDFEDDIPGGDIPF